MWDFRSAPRSTNNVCRMPPENDETTTESAAHLLKGAALVFAVLGITMAGWGVDKWIEMPGARASQFGFTAPLWPAFICFVVLATGVIVWLLIRAARRVEDGHKLFAQRHRRPRDETDRNSAQES